MRPRGVLQLAAALGIAVLLVVVQVRLEGEPQTAHGHAMMLRLVEFWWALAVLGALLLARAAPRRMVLLVLAAGALAVAVGGFGRGPQLSDDLYRYAWDGRVQAAGVDPYRYTPVAPALSGLRDGWLFPDPSGCVVPPTAPSCTRINYRNAHTIYPPVGEAWFTLVHYLPGFDRERHLQLWGDAVSLALVGLLAAMLRAAGRSPGWAALYAWSPLAGVDVGADAHVDVLAALLGVAGLHLAMRRRPAWAGGLLGAAIAVKLYPAVLLPAAVLPAVRRGWRPAGVAMALVAVSYVPHVLAVGPGVLGFLPQYLSVEGYSSGGRFLLLSAVGLSGGIAKTAAVVFTTGMAAACWRAKLAPTRAALWTFGTVLLVATPVQPWYAITLVALAAVEARWEWIAVAAAGYPLYAQMTEGSKALVGTRSFALALAIVAVVSIIRWIREREDGRETIRGDSTRQESQLPAGVSGASCCRVPAGGEMTRSACLTANVPFVESHPRDAASMASEWSHGLWQLVALARLLAEHHGRDEAGEQAAAVLRHWGVEVEDLPSVERTGMLADLRSQLLQAVKAVTGTPEPGWFSEDRELLQSQGRHSRRTAGLLGGPLAETLPDLRNRLSGPRAAFLDVGVGVAQISLGLCDTYPRLRCPGIDVFAPALELAAGNVGAEGREDRIELRQQSVADLDDVDCYDLVWMPLPFLPAHCVEPGLRSILRALRPGGWLVVGCASQTSSSLDDALTRFRTALWGGCMLVPGEACELITSLGYSSTKVLSMPPGTPGLAVGRRG